MFKIGHLYPKELNLYGDVGNINYLKHFLSLFNVKSKVININKNDNFPKKLDFLFAGGGPDSLQSNIYKDFIKKAKSISSFIESGKPSVFICGSYQLLGKYYLTSGGQKIPGLNIFSFYTKSPKSQNTRIIGNLKNDANFVGNWFSKQLVGFENHNGRTYLNNISPLSLTTNKNYGNNDSDTTEGFLYKKTVGSYMHGPILVKNPHLLKFLLKDSLNLNVNNKYFIPEYLAFKNATKKPR